MLELLSCPHHRIHLALELILRRGQAPYCLSQTETSHYQQINVGHALFRSLRDRAKHQGELDTPLPKCIPQYIDQSYRLDDNLAYRSKKWVSLLCPEVPSIAGASFFYEVTLYEPIDFLLHRAWGESSEAHEFSQVELSRWIEMRACQDGLSRFGPK